MKHINFPADKDRILKAIAPIIELLEESDADFKLINKIEVALDEILTNIASYAYAPETGDIDIDYDLDESDRTLTIAISDSGKEFDPLAQEDPDITLSEKDRPIGGLGIFIVKKIMDETTYQRVDGKNVLTLKKVI